MAVYLLQDLVDVDLVGLNGLFLLLGSASLLGCLLDDLLGRWCLQVGSTEPEGNT